MNSKTDRAAYQPPKYTGQRQSQTCPKDGAPDDQTKVEQFKN
jgi:hypothetical protein